MTQFSRDFTKLTRAKTRNTENSAVYPLSNQFTSNKKHRPHIHAHLGAVSAHTTHRDRRRPPQLVLQPPLVASCWSISFGGRRTPPSNKTGADTRTRG